MRLVWCEPDIDLNSLVLHSWCETLAPPSSGTSTFAMTFDSIVYDAFAIVAVPLISKDGTSVAGSGQVSPQQPPDAGGAKKGNGCEMCET
jgi:hypothetical protein